MPDLQINLREQARQGPAFVLPPEGGGTDRIDGRAAGPVITGICLESGGLSLGDLVKLDQAFELGGFPGIVRTTVRQDFAFGVVLEDADENGGVSIAQGGRCQVRAGGTITAEDFLYPSGTTGGTVESTPLRVGGIFGRALTAGVATDLVWAEIAIPVFPITVHPALGQVPGVRRHTDLIESVILESLAAYTGAGYTNEPRNVNDGDDATYHTERGEENSGGLVADLLAPMWVGAFRVRIEANSSTTLKFSRSADGAAWTLVWSQLLSAGVNEITATIAPIQYRYWKLSTTGGPAIQKFYAWELYEASGQYLYAADGADSALLDDLTADGARFLPAAGTTGQVLKKDSNSDYDVSWATGSAAITVEEIDGAPSVATSLLKMPSGSLTDEGGGTLRYAPPGRVVAVIDAGDAAISGNAEVDIELLDKGTFTAWTLLADRVGDAEVDLWLDVYGNFPPTNADAITDGHYPALSSQEKAQDLDLSDWATVDFVPGDILRVHLNSAADVHRLELTLRYVRT